MVTFLICAAFLICAYFVYSRYVERQFKIENLKEMPSKALYDGVDYIPMPLWKTMMIQLLNIAGLGPIFGAILGVTYGPVAFLWITLGGVFIGAVHDYASGMISLRYKGLSFPEIVGMHLGLTVKQVMRGFTLLLMVLVGAVFMVGPAAIIKSMTRIDQDILVIAILVYYILATLLPIDKIIGKIYPVFGAALILMAVFIFYVLMTGEYPIPELSAATFKNMKIGGESNFPIFPTLFITIACGAVSGFHATQSPMMARCVNSQAEGRPVFFGAMIMESFIALIWAAVGMAFFYGVDGLNQALAEHGNNAAWAVDTITKTTLGKVGATLALIGVVVAPITSGDTAFRSARLIAADFLKVSQKSLMKRLYISIPLFVIGFAITLMQFDVIWKYFAWVNQTLAVICLWTIVVDMAKRAKNYFIVLFPAIFMNMVVVMYILIAPEGFMLDYNSSLIITTVVTIIITAMMCYKIKKEKGIDC